MAITKTNGSEIKGIVTVIPEKVEDNLHLDELKNTDRQALIDHTGIRYRRKVEKNSTTIKSLFEVGINDLLSTLDWDKLSIDIIICVTQTPNIGIPSISCQLHGDLGFSEEAIAYDINSGCSGFVYGLHTVQQLLASIDKKTSRALLCCGDISSLITDENDLAVRPIFSDAASVTALEYNSSINVNSYFNLETIGKGQRAIYSESTPNGNMMRLDGIDVFNYSVQYVSNNINALLNYINLDLSHPDAYFFHQANLLINEHIRKSMGIDTTKVPYSLHKYGNTASASIPLTIISQIGEIPENSGHVLLCGFGVGFSVGSVLTKLDRNAIFQLINVSL